MASTFALDISRFVKKAQGNIDLVQKKVMLDMGKRIIMRTPVDTGRARANWMFGISTPKQQTVTTVDKGPTTQDGRGASTTVTKFTSDLLSAGEIKDRSMFLTNSVEYILPLEYGYSQQALGGMVRLTVAEFAGVVKDAVTFTRSK